MDQPVIYPETNDQENVNNSNKKIQKTQDIEELENEQNIFFIIKDKNSYILSCSLKKNDSILLKLKLYSNSITSYYESIYQNENLFKISNLFLVCQDIHESFNLLIDILNKNENNIKLDFINDDKAKLSLFVELPTKKKENTYILLNKKQIKLKKNTNENKVNELNELNNKIEKIQKNQSELEKKLEEKLEILNTIVDKQNYLEIELKNKIKEIEQIKLFQNNNEEKSENDVNKIDIIEKEQKDILLSIDHIKEKQKYIDEINNKNEQNIDKILKKFPEIETKIELIKNNQDEMQKVLNNKNNEIEHLTERLLNFQNSLDKIKVDINSIKENQSKIKDKIREKNEFKLKQEEIEENKNNIIKENKKEDEEYIKEIIKQIEDIKKENKIMKEKIKNNEQKLISFMKIIDNNLNEIEYEKINPADFQFVKNISSELFNINAYNNRACIFSSYQDDNVYIAYGIVLSLNLECYDVLNNKKFIIIKQLHKDAFDSCRYFFDEIQKRDLIITSSLDSHVKLLNFKKEKSEIILDLNFESIKDAIINTVCLFKEYIIVPFSREGKVKFYSMNSDYIGELEGDAGFILGLNKYYWENKNLHYALIANNIGIYVFIIEGFCLYHKFIPPAKAKKEEKKEEKKEKYSFDEPYIIEKDDTLILIGPCFYCCYIYLWDFLNGDLIYIFETISGVSDICIWNNKYIFASLINNQTDCQFELINLESKEIEKKFGKREKEDGAGIKVLRHKSKGDYLICISSKGNLDLYKINK